MEFIKYLFENCYWYILISCVLIELILIERLLTPKIIGWFGEHWVKQALSKLPKEEYTIINDVMLKENEKTHQIDHLVVSKYGIFVIETKQYNGYITGSKYDEKWVRHLANGKKMYYTNPIRQNYGHVKTVEELLGLDDKGVFNIICIPSNAKLNIKHNGELTRYDTLLERIMSHKEIVIANPEEIINRINELNIKDIISRKVHNIDTKLNMKHIDNNICPKCGGQLIERKGYSVFLGCSNYPKCKYTRKLK